MFVFVLPNLFAQTCISCPDVFVSSVGNVGVSTEIFLWSERVPQQPQKHNVPNPPHYPEPDWQAATQVIEDYDTRLQIYYCSRFLWFPTFVQLVSFFFAFLCPKQAVTARWPCRWHKLMSMANTHLITKNKLAAARPWRSQTPMAPNENHDCHHEWRGGARTRQLMFNTPPQAMLLAWSPINIVGSFHVSEWRSLPVSETIFHWWPVTDRVNVRATADVNIIQKNSPASDTKLSVYVEHLERCKTSDYRCASNFTRGEELACRAPLNKVPHSDITGDVQWRIPAQVRRPCSGFVSIHFLQCDAGKRLSPRTSKFFFLLCHCAVVAFCNFGSDMVLLRGKGQLQLISSSAWLWWWFFLILWRADSPTHSGQVTAQCFCT